MVGSTEEPHEYFELNSPECAPVSRPFAGGTLHQTGEKYGQIEDDQAEGDLYSRQGGLLDFVANALHVLEFRPVVSVKAARREESKKPPFLGAFAANRQFVSRILSSPRVIPLETPSCL